MSPSASLRDTLAALLPRDLRLTVYHLSHIPTKTHPLYFPPPNKAPQPTSVEAHFLAVSHDGILCFAIELLVYVTAVKHPETGKSYKESTFFVSKADSSGYLPPSAASYVPRDSPEIKDSTLRTISSAFLEHIVREHRLAHPKIRKSTVSLFARSQASYIFPGSDSNSKKHVLNDRGLIRWWCRVLDPILQSFNGEESADTASAYLLVPGFDKYETMALFPPKTRQPALYPNAKRWVHGHPLKVDPAKQLTVREVIPHFPDDPKARFILDLDAENTGGSGSRKQVKRTGGGSGGWTAVQTLDQFWEFMSFRQECSSGASTGFIWITIETKKQKLSLSIGTGLNESKVEADANASQETPSSQDASHMHEESSSQDALPSTNTTHHPTYLRFTSTNYKKVQETLACGDFSTEPLARLHSRKWVDGATTLLGDDAASARLKELKSEGKDWGMPIIGKRAVETTSSTASIQPSSTGNTVNILTVRKKHKRDDEPGKLDTMNAEASNGVNVLGAGFIRKKPKLDNGTPSSPPPQKKDTNGATVLAPGLIRKKPKPEANAVPNSPPPATTGEDCTTSRS